jgi:hypothetical protein
LLESPSDLVAHAAAPRRSASTRSAPKWRNAGRMRYGSNPAQHRAYSHHRARQRNRPCGSSDSSRPLLLQTFGQPMGLKVRADNLPGWVNRISARRLGPSFRSSNFPRQWFTRSARPRRRPFGKIFPALQPIRRGFIFYGGLLFARVFVAFVHGGPLCPRLIARVASFRPFRNFSPAT